MTTECRVTSVTFGLGLQSSQTRTRGLDEHAREMSAQGWHLIAVDRNSEEIPLTWRFFWERGEPGLHATAEHSKENAAS